MITNLMEGRTIPVYGRGENIRDWIYVTNTCAAIDRMLHQGSPGEAYNVGGESEKRNIDLAREILSLFHKGDECLTFVQDRPGHDFRYALDNSKIKTALGWNQTVSLQEGIERTVNWYRENTWWWKPLKEKLAREIEGFWSKK
jgi:dTDP-glucose 4,6-dehydratase